MKALSYFFALCFSLCILNVYGQETDGITDEQILELYKDLRVADVADGLDMVGLRDLTIMNQRIEALWKDIDNFGHIFRGSR